jgi:ABC-type multidrug transport system ATPase subunit
MGADGSGKTTLIRILTTLLIPDSGSARVENLNPVKNYRELRKIVGYMPGRFSLYQDLTVEENLNFFASVFNTTVAENYELIKGIYSHIEPFKNRRAGDLSGGMKQKLALSCALIHKPEVLFLDEPTTGVDAVSRKEFWEMLKDLQTKGITIFVSTPYMDEAGLCNRIALIHKGKILKTESPANITKQYEKQLFKIKTENKFTLLKDLREYENAYSVNSFGQFVHYSDKNNSRTESEIINYLNNKKHKRIFVEKTTASVEDCFIDLSKEN